jgi:hypothetical protein
MLSAARYSISEEGTSRGMEHLWGALGLTGPLLGLYCIIQGSPERCAVPSLSRLGGVGDAGASSSVCRSWQRLGVLPTVDNGQAAATKNDCLESTIVTE